MQTRLRQLRSYGQIWTALQVRDGQGEISRQLGKSVLMHMLTKRSRDGQAKDEEELNSSLTLHPYNYVLRVQPRALPDILAIVSVAQEAQIWDNNVLLWLDMDRIFMGSKLPFVKQERDLEVILYYFLKKKSIWTKRMIVLVKSEIVKPRENVFYLSSLPVFHRLLSCGILCTVLIIITQGWRQQAEEGHRKCF